VAKVVWTERALADFEAILNEAPAAARSLGGQIILAVEQLDTFPRSGRIVPERGDAAIRESIVQRYRVVYRLRGELVELLAIRHGARHLGDN
jgi:plasmid stabilization system protein ParE